MTAGDATSSSAITLGFRLAGAMNVFGVLIFSLGFTNHQLTALSPVVFSPFGLLCIILWGLAYVAISKGYEAVPYLSAVFAVEKLVYVVTWISWMGRFGGDLPRLFRESPLTATFFVIYGPNDLLFGIFFAVVAAAGLRRRG